MKKIILAVFLGALVLFVWNALSWMVLGLHTAGYDNIPEEVMVLTDWEAAMPEAGAYHYPGLPENGDWEALAQKMEEGPVVSLMVFLPDGKAPFSTSDFVWGFIYNLIAVGVLFYLMSQSKVNTFTTKLLFATLFGVFATFSVELPFASWYSLPASFVMPNVLDHIIGYMLVGLVGARFINT